MMINFFLCFSIYAMVNVFSGWYINPGLTKCFLKLIYKKYLKRDM